MAENYKQRLERELDKISARGETPRLLLHSCCAPCSSYVLQYLSEFFEITILYYNPNIYPLDEFEKRAGEQVRLLSLMDYVNPVELLVAEYDASEFEAAVQGLADEPEGGKRCENCFRLRLDEAARFAAMSGYDYFTTTLSVSPHKDAEALNRIGGELAARYGVPYLYSDFKKRDGYKQSIALAARYGLYRQDYCGCQYSLRNAQTSAGNQGGDVL